MDQINRFKMAVFNNSQLIRFLLYYITIEICFTHISGLAECRLVFFDRTIDKVYITIMFVRLCCAVIISIASSVPFVLLDFRFCPRTTNDELALAVGCALLEIRLVYCNLKLVM